MHLGLCWTVKFKESIEIYKFQFQFYKGLCSRQRLFLLTMKCRPPLYKTPLSMFVTLRGVQDPEGKGKNKVLPIDPFFWSRLHSTPSGRGAADQGGAPQHPGGRPPSAPPELPGRPPPPPLLATRRGGVSGGLQFAEEKTSNLESRVPPPPSRLVRLVVVVGVNVVEVANEVTLSRGSVRGWRVEGPQLVRAGEWVR